MGYCTLKIGPYNDYDYYHKYNEHSKQSEAIILFRRTFQAYIFTTNSWISNLTVSAKYSLIAKIAGSPKICIISQVSPNTGLVISTFKKSFTVLSGPPIARLWINQIPSKTFSFIIGRTKLAKLCTFWCFKKIIIFLTLLAFSTWKSFFTINARAKG